VLWDTAGITLEVELWDTAAVGVTLEEVLVVCDTESVTLEEVLVVCDTENVTLELELEEVVAVILVLCDTAVVGEPLVLELEEPVADTLVLSETAVVCEPLEIEEVVADTVVLSDTAVVTLGLDEVVGDMLELESQDIDSDGELDITKPGDTDTDWVSVRDEDVVTEGTEGAREALILLDVVRESVASADGLRDILRLTLSDLELVRSVDSLADTLRLAVTDRESVGSIDPLAVTLLDTEVDAVSEAVKLGDTGDFVKDGVGVGEGMIAVYDMKNTDPEPRLIILAPICDPPEL
jgi:hypothetical protein